MNLKNVDRQEAIIKRAVGTGYFVVMIAKWKYESILMFLWSIKLVYMSNIFDFSLPRLFVLTFRMRWWKKLSDLNLGKEQSYSDAVRNYSM